MKKIFWKFLMISIFAAVFTTSCFLMNDEEDDKLEAPTISVFENRAYSISSEVPANTITANIFRQSSTDKDFDNEKNISTENIGQAVPQPSDAAPISYLTHAVSFTDTFTEENKYYRYAIRFYDGSLYTWTHYSPACDGKGIAEASIEWTTKEMTFKRSDDESVYSLSLSGTITIPNEFTKLAVVLNNGKISKPFPLEFEKDTSEDSETTYAVKNIVIEKLQKTLTDDFFDKKLAVLGLIAINESKITNINYYWTNLLKFEKPAIDSEDTEDFMVPPPEKTENPMLFSIR
ncbi:MAG: hypothetical protein KBT11_07055 [Treponema sp.]|nr:hypothetical protein [Candidatus Treponema equifaecale]